MKKLIRETAYQVKYYTDKIQDLNDSFFSDCVTASMEHHIRQELTRVQKKKDYYNEVLEALLELEDLKNGTGSKNNNKIKKDNKENNN